MLWNKSLETGMPKIDEQHKELFRQVDILMDRSNDNRIPQTLAFLANYVVKHFSDEQVLHVASKYPKAAAHKQLHVAFVKKFKDLKQRYESDTSSNRLLTVHPVNAYLVEQK